MPESSPSVDRLDATALRITTPAPEADGTLSWDATTIVIVQAHCGRVSGLGWTYADGACVDLMHGVLTNAVRGRGVLDVPACWLSMQQAVRNHGRPGLVSCAGSAVDIALWDAAARLTGLPLSRQLADHDVTWFEEPVSSDDLDGLRQVRGSVLADVAAGEYGYDLAYFTRMIGVGAVDCVQVDVTRCGGYTEWRRIAALAAAHNLEVSAHCAPNLSAHVARGRHAERPPPGVVRRPPSDRADAVRRQPRSGRRAGRTRPELDRARPHARSTMSDRYRIS